MECVSIKNSKGLSLYGLEIDHKRKPYSKALISDSVFSDKQSGSGYFTAVFGEEYPICEKTPMTRFCVFDLYANRFAHYGEMEIISRRQIAPQIWRFDFEGLRHEIKGNELYVWHTFHSRPAILIEDSENITLKQLSIYSQPGMGIVAHRSENLHFDGLRIIPSCGEHMSTNTDAVHISSCKGEVKIENSFFEGQGDDSLNIHTYYHRIKNPSGNSCEIYLDSPTKTHSQSPDYPDEGDIMELTDSGSLAVLGTYKVISRTQGDDFFSSRLIFDKALPENCEQHFFANATRQPRLIFRNNVCRSHISRGILIKIKEALIEDNSFIDVIGTAIYVAAESWWREGICSSDSIVIRRNRISFAGRTASIRPFGCAGICVSVSAERPDAKTHKSVTIEDNIIDCPDSPLGIYVAAVQKLSLSRNSIVCAEKPLMIEDFPPADE